MAQPPIEAEIASESGGAKSAIQSIDRAVALLNVIAAAGPAGESLGVIAAATGIHASTARTLLSSLGVHGLLDQDARSRRYRLGPRFFELRRLYDSQADLAAVAAPILKELWERSRETVHLAVLQGGRRIDLSVLVSPQLLNVNPTITSLAEQERPADNSSANALFTTAAGKVLLLGMSPDERREHLHAIGAIVTTHGTVDPERALKDLAKVEATGVATNFEDEEPGVCGVAAPVFDGHGDVCAALCIGYPSVRRSPSYDAILQQLVVEGAQRISTSLGAGSEAVPDA